MALKVYNTLTRKKELFMPINKNKVRLFVCGPTIYDFSHMGHAKTYVQFDIIVKYLRYKKYNVFYLQNITDIDDKIINRARELNITPKELASKYEKYYYEDMKSLGVNSITKYARATDFIPEIVSQVKRLIKKDYAYKIDDGYYYDITKFEDYGKLSGRTVLQAEDAVSRIDEGVNKRNKGDFCLWKFSKLDEPSWKTDIGNGRPGWHIEDTAITEKIFGPQYDIHGGAVELVFPHHEAEIAQMEAISGKKPLVKYWLHTGVLNVEGKKMSKSLGNFITIRGALKKLKPQILRLYFASIHYRSPIDFNEKSLDSAKIEYKKFENFIISLKNVKEKTGKSIKELVKSTKKKFMEAMDDDFNVSVALAVILEFISKINTLIAEKNLSKKDAEEAYKLMLEFGKIFCLDLAFIKIKKFKIPEKIKKLLKEREVARKNKDWGEADKIRKIIEKEGWYIDDTQEGPILKRIENK